LDNEVIELASSNAAAMFKQVGIRTAWVPCGTNHPASIAPPCEANPDPTVIAMRILSVPLPMQHSHSYAVFGFTFPAGPSGFASTANVFWSRVRDLSDAYGVHPGRLLAAIIAHEAGHLLLGENSHYPVGIMKAVWDDAEVRRIAQNSLFFSSGQTNALQKGVRERARYVQRPQHSQVAAALRSR
jgi:hypothetical protein